MIFLDNASTTPVLNEISDLIAKTNLQDFYNPSALYSEGVEVKTKIFTARRKIAGYLGVEEGNIIFTSGATEGNNLAIFGLLTAKKDAEFLFSEGEHASVYNVAKALKERGAVVKFINLKDDGSVDEDHLKSLLNPNTAFVSIIHVSNETGSVNDIKNLCKIVKDYKKDILFHSDGVQALGKIELNVEDLGVDAYTISGHKLHAPKGIGAIYVKPVNRLKPQILGGGQQGGLRSGTENVSGILALALASEIAVKNIGRNYENAEIIRDIFKKEIADNLTDFSINEGNVNSPYILSVSFKGIPAEVLVHLLQKKGVIVATGSACSGKNQENRVLKSMGKSQELIKGSIRVSFSSQTAVSEAENAAKIFVEAVKELKSKMSKFSKKNSASLKVCGQ